MSFMPDTSPVFMYTNNASFTVAKNATSYLPSNLNSLYENETSYDSSSNSLKSSKCVCNFDFWGSNTKANDTLTQHKIKNENNVEVIGRNTSPYKGTASRVEDNIANVGNSLLLSFFRNSTASTGVVTIAQNRAFFAGVSLK